MPVRGAELAGLKDRAQSLSQGFSRDNKSRANFIADNQGLSLFFFKLNFFFYI